MVREAPSPASWDRADTRSMRSSVLDDWVYEAFRMAAKTVFAAADVFLGTWPGSRILIYHQIVADPGRQMGITPEMFARQIDWLSGNGRIVGLEEALVDPDRTGADHDFVLTFDDGYRGVFETAFPILKDRGIPFTLYLTTQLVSNGVPARPGEEPLNWNQVCEMIEEGPVTLGAHTHTHRDLRGLTVGQIEDELDESNYLIERHTGQRPKHFAYPKGYWAADAEPLVRRRYETAVLGGGPPITGATDRYRLSRVPVQQSDGLFFFKRKLLRGMRLEEQVRSRLKGYDNPTSEKERVEG